MEEKTKEQILIEELNEIKKANVKAHEQETLELDQKRNCGRIVVTLIKVNGKLVEVPVDSILSTPIFIRSVSK